MYLLDRPQYAIPYRQLLLRSVRSSLRDTNLDIIGRFTIRQVRDQMVSR